MHCPLSKPWGILFYRQVSRGEEVEEYTDPELIQENWGKQIDMVVDGGIGGINPSTVVDCTTDNYEIIRQGAGVWDF